MVVHALAHGIRKFQICHRKRLFLFVLFGLIKILGSKLTDFYSYNKKCNGIRKYQIPPSFELSTPRKRCLIEYTCAIVAAITNEQVQKLMNVIRSEFSIIVCSSLTDKYSFVLIIFQSCETYFVQESYIDAWYNLYTHI